MEYIKKYGTTALLVVVIIVLLGFLLQDCSGSRKQINELRDSQKEIAELKKALDESATKYSLDSTERARQLLLATSIAERQKSELDKANKSFKDQGIVVRRLTAQINIPHHCDSTGIVRRAVDSLISVIDQMSLTYAGMEANMTILIEQQTTKDSLYLVEHNAVYSELAKTRQTLVKIFDENVKMREDLVKALKKVKNKGFWNRVFAGTALASLIYASVK